MKLSRELSDEAIRHELGRRLAAARAGVSKRTDVRGVVA
jgi:hypothetical protein